MELFEIDTVGKEFKNISGMVVNEYVVKSFAGWMWYNYRGGTIRKRVYYYNCICSCGKEFLRGHTEILRKEAISCGCKRTMKKHNARSNKNKTYKSWKAMKERCLSSGNVAFMNYGGRGITVCDRWLESFENFLEDMGERPEGTSIDRIDSNGNYCQENCRWVTGEVQSYNTRKSKKNTSGRTGVYWNKHVNKWIAYIRLDGKSKHIGYFKDFTDAVKAREAAEVEVYGFNKE